MPRKGNSKHQALLQEQLAAASVAPDEEELVDMTLVNEEYDSSSDDSDDDDNFDMSLMEDPPEPEIPPHTVPEISYFELRKDKDKRAYVESFADILGKVKTNYHFRCKACGESFIGQYLNMLVHMSGAYNHLSVRARPCTKPFPATKAKILQDYADYNLKQQLLMSQIKQEPGVSLELDPIPIKRSRGRKRILPEVGGFFSQPRPYKSTMATGYVVPGTAVFENAIGQRSDYGNSVTHRDVNEYYSKVLAKSADLKTSCCTTSGAPPAYLQRALSRVHPDVANKYYGCGFIAPELLYGQRVLDLGCGAGRDCYVLAQLVGEYGHVVGVDMSADQLASARATMEWHREKFGYAHTNTTFVQAYLERLLPDNDATQPGLSLSAPVTSHNNNHSSSSNGHDSFGSNPNSNPNSSSLVVHPTSEAEDENEIAMDATLAAFSAAARTLLEGQDAAEEPATGLAEGSFDVIVSNCVVNLSPDKAAVISNAFRLLKPGGEFYFSDVYCTQRVPSVLRDDPVLWSECLSGALYWNDFLRLAKLCGFADPRLVTSSPIQINNARLEEAIAQHMPPTLGANGQPQAQFYSATYRLWKIAELEPDCEDYGQAVQYLGTIPYPAGQEPATAGLTGAAVRPLPLPLGGLMTNQNEREGLLKSFDIDAELSPVKSAPAPVKLISAYKLDDHHVFPTGKVMPVCGNSFRMLNQTRLKNHFRFFGGNFTQHYGIFDGCGKSMPFASGSGGSSSCC